MSFRCVFALSKPSLRRVWHGLGALFFVAASPVAAKVECPKAEPLPAGSRGQYTFTWENDIVGGTDEDYTNGNRHAFDTAARAPHGFGGTLARVLFRATCDDAVGYGFAFGQSMFTPRDTAAVVPSPEEHPYAGWLYGEFSLSVTKERAKLAGRSLETAPRDQQRVTVLAGVVGPSALGEQTQNTFHRWIANPPSLGWDTQLQNEPGLALLYDRRWRYAAVPLGGWWGAELLPSVGASLGNVLTYASAGLTARVGTDLDTSDLPVRIRPGPTGAGSLFAPGSPVRGFFFAGIEGRAVARNMFLDGNSFRESARVEKNKAITELHAGLVLQVFRVQAAYSFAVISEEFTTQPQPHRFGAASLSWRW